MQLIRAKFQSLKPVLDERIARLWAGAEAEALGEGGIAIVEEALAKFGAPIYVRHEVVHNRVVVDDLKRKGAVFVEEATGMSRTTIRAGRDELRAGVDPGDVVKVRRAGGGRPSIEQMRPEIVPALEALVEVTRRNFKG